MERKKIISPPKKKSEKNAGKLNNDTAINDSVSVRPQVHLYSDVWPGNGPLIYRRPLTDRPNWWTAFLFLSSFFFYSVPSRFHKRDHSFSIRSIPFDWRWRSVSPKSVAQKKITIIDWSVHDEEILTGPMVSNPRHWLVAAGIDDVIVSLSPSTPSLMTSSPSATFRTHFGGRCSFYFYFFLNSTCWWKVLTSPAR